MTNFFALWWLINQTAAVSAVPYLLGIILAAGLFCHKRLVSPISAKLSGRDVLWLLSPTLCALAMLFFAANHPDADPWREPSPTGYVFAFNGIALSAVGCTGYVIWRLKRLPLFVIVACLPQLWQIGLSWFVGGMLITGNWI